MSIGNMTRLVEVSHWGNNVAIEDRIQLENRGPECVLCFNKWVVMQTELVIDFRFCNCVDTVDQAWLVRFRGLFIKLP